MISMEILRDLYDYNYWARDRQLKACAALSEEEFRRPMGNSYSSLCDTLKHLLGAEWVWHERFCGRSPRSVAWFNDVETLDSIRDRWAGVEADMRAYLAALKAEEMTRPLTYINLQGETWTYPLWQTLVHLVNHQSYHRGQVTTLLRQHGANAPAVDFLVYYDTRG